METPAVKGSATKKALVTFAVITVSVIVAGTAVCYINQKWVSKMA